MLKYYLFFCFLFSLQLAFSASFEGVIEMMRHSYYDTSYYQYHVKGDHVRIDEFDRNRNIRNVLLVDMKSRKVYAINMERKLFKELPSREAGQPTASDHFQVTKTGNTKTINGYECHQWRVRNVKRNSEIAYWVAKNGFDFYDKLMDVLHSFENTSLFFRAISDARGFMPILAVERTLVRYEKERLMVTSIERQYIHWDVFAIPDDFRSFDY